MLFVKSTPQSPVATPVTAEEAQVIYAWLENGNSETEIFKVGHSFAHSAQVVAEIRRLENEALAAMQGGNCPESKEELMALLSSDILDIETLVDDVIKYHPSYSEEISWDLFHAYFNPPPPEELPEEPGE